MNAKITIIETDRLAMTIPSEKSVYEACLNEAFAGVPRLKPEHQASMIDSLACALHAAAGVPSAISHHGTSVIVEPVGGPSQAADNCGT